MMGLYRPSRGKWNLQRAGASEACPQVETSQVVSTWTLLAGEQAKRCWQILSWLVGAGAFAGPRV